MIINRYHKTLSLSLACLLYWGCCFPPTYGNIRSGFKMQTGLLRSSPVTTIPWRTLRSSLSANNGRSSAITAWRGECCNQYSDFAAGGCQSFGTCQFSSASNQYNGSTLQTTINGSGVLGSIPAKEQS